MSYMALHHRWHLISFEDVKGQDPTVQTLRDQITSERTGHVYLFCGTRRTGKTSIAKVSVRAVNCEYPMDGSPYNECPAYRSIQSGPSMGVMKISAASNNGMEDICDIGEQVQYPPTEGRYRVYIIDEVHTFSIGALSALLKTLEEPPFYMIFILAATEVHRVPIMILSHCQRYDFKRISLETVADHLRELTQAEQIQVEGKALLYVAKAADGLLRDALSLLDQCVASHYGGVLTYDNILEVLEAVGSSVFSQMFGAIVEGRTRDYTCNPEEIAIQGRELGQSVTDFTWYMRNLLLIRSTDDTEGPVDMSEENLEQPRSNTGEMDGITLIRYVRIFSELPSQLRYVNQKRVLVEMALIKLIRPSMEPNLGVILQRLENLEAQMEDLEVDRVAIPVIAAYQAAGSPLAGQVPQAGAGPGQGGGVASQTAAPYAPGLQVEPEVMLEKVVLSRAQLEDLKLVGNEQVKIVRSMGGGVRSYLRNTVVEPGEEGCLIIMFMGSMNYDAGGRSTAIGGLERYVEASFSRSIYLKTRLAGQGECLNTVCVIQEELEEKIYMDTTYEDK